MSSNTGKVIMTTINQLIGHYTIITQALLSKKYVLIYVLILFLHKNMSGTNEWYLSWKCIAQRILSKLVVYFNLWSLQYI